MVFCPKINYYHKIKKGKRLFGRKKSGLGQFGLKSATIWTQSKLSRVRIVASPNCRTLSPHCRMLVCVYVCRCRCVIHVDTSLPPPVPSAHTGTIC